LFIPENNNNFESSDESEPFTLNKKFLLPCSGDRRQEGTVDVINQELSRKSQKRRSLFIPNAYRSKSSSE
jgi:hypothetical protein